MKNLFADIDQNLLKEYGLIKTFDLGIARLHQNEKDVIFSPEPSSIIKLLSLLDKEDEATLKVIHTYLELRLNMEFNEKKIA